MTYRSLGRWVLVNPELFLCALLLSALIVLTGLEVVLRYVFNSPIDWAGQVSGMGVVWLTFIGATGLVRRQAHARVELIEEIVGNGLLVTSLQVIFDLVSLAYVCLVAIGGYQLIGQLSYVRTPVLRMPIGYEICIVPITAAIMAAFIVWRLWQRLRLAFRREAA